MDHKEGQVGPNLLGGCALLPYQFLQICMLPCVYLPPGFLMHMICSCSTLASLSGAFINWSMIYEELGHTSWYRSLISIPEQFFCLFLELRSGLPLETWNHLELASGWQALHQPCLLLCDTRPPQHMWSCQQDKCLQMGRRKNFWACWFWEDGLILRNLIAESRTKRFCHNAPFPLPRGARNIAGAS